eukprot:5721902-Pleurochrysis_carterae.AAC.1
MGDDKWPRSAGCSRRYSAPDSRAARSKATVRSTSRNIGEAGDVFSVSNGRRTSIGHVGSEETAYGERRAGRRSHDSGMHTRCASFEQA